MTTTPPPSNTADEFYQLIENLARHESLHNVLAIGAGVGTETTEAFIRGLRDNSDRPKLFCLEPVRSKFQEMLSRYANFSFVKPYHAVSVGAQSFLSVSQISQFYSQVQTTLNQYPLEQVLSWREKDLREISETGATPDGIALIKRENQIDYFDLVLIDGSPFSAAAELEQIYGATVILLDDINDIKNFETYKRLRQDQNYQLMKESWTLRNGFAVFKKLTAEDRPKPTQEASSPTNLKIPTLKQPEFANDAVQASQGSKLAVHFFTIVVNGQPFIRHHIETFKQLSFPWHWHVIEGIAELKHDTAWSVAAGGRVAPELHNHGRSNDGTTEYLDEIARQYPQQVTVYRKPAGTFWDGKLEMVQAPLSKLKDSCLLFQVDSDELWCVEQLERINQLFCANPEKTSAYFLCRYFVGEDRVITSRDTYGNNTSYEWLRVWRFLPGSRWQSHEPPTLCAFNKEGQPVDLGKLNPIRHAETERLGLVFDHYAYVTAQQLKFKEYYYGYPGAVAQWQALQSCKQFPVKLRDYFAWVKDEAVVETVASQSIKQLAQKNIRGEWRFRNHEASSEKIGQILLVRDDSIGDNILAMGMLEPLKTRFPEARINIVCRDHIAHIYQACPLVDRVICYDHGRAMGEEVYLNKLLQEIQSTHPDLALNTVYSPTVLSHVLTLSSGAKTKVGFRGNLCNISPEQREHFSKFYSHLLESAEARTNEVEHHSDFLKALGAGTGQLPLPKLWTTQQDEEYVDELLDKHELQPERCIIMFAGGQQEFKHYAGFGQALSQICKQNNFSLIAVGAATEYELNKKNLTQCAAKSVNLCGQTTLLQSAALMRRCRLAVGSDTSLAHVACAVGIPQVVLLGGGHFGRFFPYSGLTSVVCLPLECYGCNWRCNFASHHCIQDVSPQTISFAIEETLKRDHTKALQPRVYFQQKCKPTQQANSPQWKACNAWLGTSVELIPVELTPQANWAEKPNLTKINITQGKEEYWQDCQIVKERCEDSPGVIMLGHCDCHPSEERIRALEKYGYFVISTSCSRDDNVAWLPHPRCIAALLHRNDFIAEVKRRFPEKLVERMNCLMVNFLRTATQHPSWMATLAGLPYNEASHPALKTLDLSSCWTSVPLKRTELVVETALQGKFNTYIITQEYGTRDQIVRKIEDIARYYSANSEIFYMPFEQYALQQIGGHVIIDGRPIGINNGIVASIIDKTRVYIHTSETEGIPNSIVECLMRNVPVLICNDILGPLPELAKDIGPCITLADPNAKALKEAANRIIANYGDYSKVRDTFRAQFDPFEMNRRMVRHCQKFFASHNLPWKGNWQGLSTGMSARFNLAADIPAYEQIVGQKPVYPNFDLTTKYFNYQMQLAKKANNQGALALLEQELKILTERWAPR